MSSPVSAAIPDTSWNLLRSVQDGSPTAGWSRLVFSTRPVVARWCRCAGLQDPDADNVVQEVFVTLLQHLGAFRSDRGSGRFRAFWRPSPARCIADHHRRETRQPVPLDAAALQLLEAAAPDGSEVDAIFRDLELRRALDVVRSEVAASTWEAFQRTVLEEQARTRSRRRAGADRRGGAPGPVPRPGEAAPPAGVAKPPEKRRGAKRDSVLIGERCHRGLIPMDCLDRERLLVCLHGDITPPEVAHLESCPQCQHALTQPTAMSWDELGGELRRAAREPGYAPIEVERAVALVASLGKPPVPAAAAVGLSTAEFLAPAATATVGKSSQGTDPAAPPTPSIPLPFLSPPQAPGELGRLGGYRVLGVLGHGGMGVVLRAEEVQLDRQVAIKVMLPEIAADTLSRERFLREARAMARVEHRHVVPIYRVDEANGVVYLVMKLLQGESLEERLRPDRRLGVAEAVRAAREAAEGLAAAHARDLVHRDIKPANLWLETALDGGWQAAGAGLRPGPAGTGRRPATITARRGRRHTRLHGSGTGRGCRPGRPLRPV